MHFFLHHLLHPLKAIWIGRIGLFLPIWAFLTTAAVVLTAWVIPARTEKQASETARCRSMPTRAEAFGLLALFGCLACYSVSVLAWEDFTYYDNSHFTNGSLIGRPISLQISPEQGRFWPLGHQEFNLLGRITHSIAGYHGLRIVELSCVSILLLFLLDFLKISTRVWIVVLLLITPSVLISFGGLIYPEANEMLLLVVLVWAVRQYELAHLRIWAILAVVASQFLLYYKETAFILIAAFAVSRLAMRSRNEGGWNARHLRDPESRLDACLCVLVASFLLWYFAALYPHFGMRYETGARLTFSSVLSDYLRVDLLAWLFLVIWAVRTLRLLRGDVAPSLIYDGLGTAGAACFSGYIALAMFSAYYLAPVDMIAIVYLGRVVAMGWAKWSPGVRSTVLVCGVVVCLQDLSLSSLRVYERKNVVRAKAEIGQAIRERFQKDPQDVRRLYFPSAKPFVILEFASYLNYIGVRIEQGSAKGVELQGVALVGPQIRISGPCGYRTFFCHPAQGPQPGDLVVILPDDTTNSAATRTYLEHSSEILFAYQPHPTITAGLRPWVDHLHFISPAFETQPFPDSWLTGSVSVWGSSK